MESVERLRRRGRHRSRCRTGARSSWARSDRRRKREPDWRGVSSRNSVGIHASIYYRIGLDKTLLCVEGKSASEARRCYTRSAKSSEFRTRGSRLATPEYKAFHRGECRFRRTYQLPNRRCSTRVDTRRARVDRLTTRTLRSSLTDHAPCVKTRFDFLDDRAEDAVDLEILWRVDRRDACGLQSAHVGGWNDPADDERHVFKAGPAQEFQHLFGEGDMRARQDRQADAMDA